MNWLIKSAVLVVLVGFLSGTSCAADTSKDAKPEGARTQGDAPATGDQDTAKMASETVRGKVIKSGDGLYTIETGPGQQVQIRAGEATKFEDGYKGVEGDWIQALVTPDMHIRSIRKSTPAYTVEGDVLRAEGDFFVVKDAGGKEIRLQQDGNTKIEGTHKVGDRVRAEYTPDGHALSVKPTVAQRGVSGG